VTVVSIERLSLFTVIASKGCCHLYQQYFC